MATVQTIIVISTTQNEFFYQIDVKNAFHRGDMKKDMYMKPPSGLLSIPTSDAWKLKRSLYGLK